jgi:hypothetical protein
MNTAMLDFMILPPLWKISGTEFLGELSFVYDFVNRNYIITVNSILSECANSEQDQSGDARPEVSILFNDHVS